MAVREQSLAEGFCLGQMPKCPVAEVLPLWWQRTAQVRDGEKIGAVVISELLMKAAWVWDKLVFTGRGGKFVRGMALCQPGWPQE